MKRFTQFMNDNLLTYLTKWVKWLYTENKMSIGTSGFIEGDYNV